MKPMSQTIESRPLPKIRKYVTTNRSFPPNCGEDYATFGNEEAMDIETNSCIVIYESNNSSIEDDNKDFQIIEEPLKSFSDGDMVKDQNESSPVTENIPSKNVEDETDDSEIRILTTSEWNHLQSGFKCHDDSMKSGKEICDEHSNGKEMKNECIVPYDASKSIATSNQVQQTLMLFEDLYTKLFSEYKAKLKGGRVTKQMHVEAAITLRNERKWVNVDPMFGHVPGVEVGDRFQFRVQLAMIGLHHEFICGINCVTIDGKKYANSVVDSGRYENKVLSRDVILYSGQGGNPKVLVIDKPEHQKLEGGNLALKHSKDANLPVRVIRKISLGNTKMYIYEGLYNVTNFWQERTRCNKMAYMFQMVRISSQPDCNYQEINQPTTAISYLEQNNHMAIPNDLSQGKEKIPISIVNDLSDETPQSFTYITEMIYPSWYHLSEPSACDCIDGCSDYKPCYCAYQNGGEIPYNEKGSIVKAKHIVHECGPLCKCPPSCQNRVSQRGPRFQLEVFKTKSTGWGVRSREDIPSGSFICEYIGELLNDKEAEMRTNDEYLFDLDDCDAFTIDAAEYGNVGRFINHSCSPNLYAQNVVYDNNDRRLPHIMLFATKRIPAMQELSYDYNYKIDRVCDAKGNIKKKFCNCGSRKCTGRMY